MYRALSAIVLVTVAATVPACTGNAQSVRIATHHPEFKQSMSCHDRCAVSFSAKADLVECFAGCPGVTTTSLACDEPDHWQGVCYQTRSAPSKASAALVFAGVVATVFTTLAIRGTLEAESDEQAVIGAQDGL